MRDCRSIISSREDQRQRERNGCCSCCSALHRTRPTSKKMWLSSWIALYVLPSSIPNDRERWGTSAEHSSTERWNEPIQECRRFENEGVRVRVCGCVSWGCEGVRVWGEGGWVHKIILSYLRRSFRTLLKGPPGQKFIFFPEHSILLKFLLNMYLIFDSFQ